MSRAKDASLSETLDKFMAEGDPLLAAAMLLGGTAAATGITPPLMRLLNVTGGSDNSDFQKMAEIAAAFAGGLVPGLLFAGFKFGQQESATEDEKGSKYYTACFCEGAVEVFLMAKLFSNPEFMKSLMSAATSGAGLLKGVAATGL